MLHTSCAKKGGTQKVFPLQAGGYKTRLPHAWMGSSSDCFLIQEVPAQRKFHPRSGVGNL